ncbi:MAG: TlpA family protein disulfide reductase [Candidatus Magnetoovum sp. WYHC-5]|nr:TlpA family protein disulfide reductase [Candidatus Magnetoovum sp. WYHC-5]
MIKSSILLFVFVIVVITGCENSRLDLLKAGDKAPEFALKDVNGGVVSLSDFKDRVVLLEFWSMWCMGCRASIPFLNTMRYTFKESELTVIALNVDAKDFNSQVKSYVKQNSMTYPIVLSVESLNESYGISVLPTMYLLDKKHNIAQKYLGFYPQLYELMPQKIKELLKGV